MGIYINTLASVTELVAVILVVVLLRNLDLISEEHAPVFSKLVTHVTLPALIFFSLSRAGMQWDYVLLAAVMLGAEILSLIIAWCAGRWLRLPRPMLGSFILVSGFGSSALLGYALIGEIFPDNIDAIAEAVVITELGVGPALFTLGTMIALYYGSAEVDSRGRIQAVVSFFRSPIFFSVCAGIAWALMGLPVEGVFLTPAFNCLNILASANTFLVALTVGVVLRFTGLWAVSSLAASVCMIKLVLKPVMVWLPTLIMPFEAWQVQIIVLEAAMPSAFLTVVLASTYGCDANLAARLVFATTVMSMLTLILMFRILA